MKLHRPLIAAVADALPEVFIKGNYADDVVRSVLKQHSKWGSRDRKWVAEIIYDIVRWWRLYCYLVGYDYMSPENVNWEQIILIALQHKNVEVDNPEIIEASALNLSIPFQEPLPMSVQVSMPDWLYELGVQELGDAWPDIARALNDPADVFLRCNTGKISREELLTLLEKAGIAAEKENKSPEAIRLLKRTNLMQHPLYKEGYFEIQDIASQQVAHHCISSDNHLIADVCAGAGGKTLHLASIVDPGATILATDIYPDRLQRLRYRAEKSGAKNIRVVQAEELSDFAGVCDVVLMDVPCSGTGILRRDPDIKWKLTPEKLADYQLTQREILEKYHSLLKPGGKIVYATCSVLPSEGEAQIQWFLKQHPKFKLLSEKRFSPQEGYDGFYIGEVVNKVRAKAAKLK